MIINTNSRRRRKHTKWFRVQVRFSNINITPLIKKNWQELSNRIFINLKLCKKIIIQI